MNIVIVAEMSNTQSERIDIVQVEAGFFKGSYVLRIHDDPPSKIIACQLLDSATIAWLLQELPKL